MMKFFCKKIKMKNNFIKLIAAFIIIFLTGCNSLKEGLEGNKKSKNAEEFLIEKKNPLVMPPKINKLPKPKDSADLENTDNNFQKKISGKSKDNLNSQLETSTSLEESIIKKIE